MTLRIVVDNDKKKRDIVQPITVVRNNDTLVMVIGDCGCRRIMTQQQADSYFCACLKKSL